MPDFSLILRADVDLNKPVPEICAVIRAVTHHHPGHEIEILRGLSDAINTRIKQIGGAAANAEQVLQPDAEQENKQ